MVSVGANVAVVTDHGAVLPAWHARQAERIEGVPRGPLGWGRHGNGRVEAGAQRGARVLLTAADEVGHRAET